MKTIMLIIFSALITFQTIPAKAENLKDYDAFKIKTQVEGLTYEAMVFKPKNQPIKSILIISPTIRGPGPVEDVNAQYFSSNGYLVIATYPFKTELQSPDPQMDKLDEDYFRPVKSVLSFLTLLQDIYQLPADIPVFALGASQGGIITVVLASHIPRIKAAWYAVGGGNLPYIFAWSEVEEIKKFRNNHMKKQGINNQKNYEEYLRNNLKNDPTISCKNINIPIHQTIALRDTSVPTVTQELMVAECPNHQVLRMDANHTSGTLSTINMRKKIKKFFEAAI